MPWRVCRVLNFKKHCTSVHSREDVAKVETANQLTSIINQLGDNVPKYRGYWGYDKYHPGFVDDMIEMIGAVRRRIEDGDVWGAYDDWHHFLQHWENQIDPPLWVQVGTVIVEGPGPTATPSWNPGTASKPWGHHPKAEAVEQSEFGMKKAYMQFFKDLTKEVILRKQQESGQVLSTEEVFNEVIRSAGEIDFDPTKEQDKDWAWMHYFDLIIKNVGEKFSVRLD